MPVFAWVYNSFLIFFSKVLDVWIGIISNFCKHILCNKQIKSFTCISYLFCLSSWSWFMFFYILTWGSPNRIWSRRFYSGSAFPGLSSATGSVQSWTIVLIFLLRVVVFKFLILLRTLFCCGPTHYKLCFCVGMMKSNSF